MYWKDEIKEKEAGNGPFFNIYQIFVSIYFRHSSSFLFFYCGCGSVGRGVASDTKGLWFESSHRQIFKWNKCLHSVNCIEKMKNKEKEDRNGPFLNIFLILQLEWMIDHWWWSSGQRLLPPPQHDQFGSWCCLPNCFVAQLWEVGPNKLQIVPWCVLYVCNLNM